MGKPTVDIESLRAEAESIVAAAIVDPEGRYALREEFYLRFGRGKAGGAGLGSSELAFLRWEIERGVLNAVDAPRAPGSAWWRAVNEGFLLDAEVARLSFERDPAARGDTPAVRAWLDFLRRPEARSWYRAHNTSIAHGYAGAESLVAAESSAERAFVNVVLYRVLFAQALTNGVELGGLGELLADPRGVSVDILLDLPAFYPCHYPLSDQDIRRVLEQGHSLPDEVARNFDHWVILPQLARLYRHAAHSLRLPALLAWEASGKPSYGASVAQAEPETPPRPAPAPRPTPMPNERPQKIAILGGGPASLAAAYELTSYPGWQDRYEVTLYQVGWRLGGKTATARGVHNRIEERGIHIFQGWYNNAFRMVQDTYAYIAENKLAPDSPLQTWQQAFVPDKATLFTEYDEAQERWTNWPMVFPFNTKLPGQSGAPPWWEMLKEAIGALLELVLGSPYAESKSGCLGLLAPWMAKTFFTPEWKKTATLPDWFSHAEAAALRAQSHHEHPLELKFLHHALDLLAQTKEKPHQTFGDLEVSSLRVVLTLFQGFAHWLRGVFAADPDPAPSSHHLMILVEFGLANLVGLVRDVYDEDTHSLDFHRINNLDYRDWLLSAGLPPKFAQSAPVRFIYCGAFHNQYRGEPGKIGADLGLRSLMVSVTYRGSLVWKMAGGTGGSLIAPLYRMLAHRGVKFEFFQAAADLVPGHSDEKLIEELCIGRQVRLATGRKEYDPLKEVDGLADWPPHPHYKQLDPEQAARLESEKIDLESPWAPWKPEYETLHRGAEFDSIILGVPIKETARICSRLVDENHRWRQMVDHVRTTATFGVQIWLSRDLEGLGMHLPSWGMQLGDEPNSVIYADLLYSWTDMNAIIKRENWPEASLPKQLSYFCGTWPTEDFPPDSDHEYPVRERNKLVDTTRDWLQANMGWLWPKATTPEWPQGLDLKLLIDPAGDPASSGEQRLLGQWFVANIEPSSHYTLAWPGSDQYRLSADESGYENLFLCGDWTNFGLNIGHMEGAVTSGLRAAQALLRSLGQKDLREIFDDTGLETGG